MYKLYELEAIHDSRKSFYKKAHVLDYGNVIKLRSYGTIVCEIRDGEVKLHGLYSMTTRRHINEFLKQNGFKGGGINELNEMYVMEAMR